jgi:sec-independent protein translocase protein TatB
VDVGFWEMFMLAVLALLIFGPERLPGIARSVGQTIGRIRREATSTFDALRDEAELTELKEFNSELQRQREELRSLTRPDPRSDRSDRSGKAAASKGPTQSGPPRFDPHAT